MLRPRELVGHGLERTSVAQPQPLHRLPRRDDGDAPDAAQHEHARNAAGDDRIDAASNRGGQDQVVVRVERCLDLRQVFRQLGERLQVLDEVARLRPPTNGRSFA